mmetsp:Transcript_14084/g.17069  ORF Transcript_14084/g.17069 Transcript_14084/m.17069 type:complete len:132 (-) Transcript_14084:458-853(-)|eukprot:CAMPEP_0197846930 /NCGR_PEP_ID=MMETSP1438-20131217/4724_1 /TAXON_ID=1461541 /ORGANISM="Pterosperma sp., Strain CCMP1384" /LENGTH=131 /DNA_ID=CAMNT_0043458721 /DNA_START=139 /DNA_END=534 /DNA_ORIENTATION=+
MDDPELEAIRQRRMQELMGAQGGGGGGMPDADQARQQQEQKEAMEEQRAAMLASVLTNSARERLHRIELVKPDKARKVEDMVLGMAQQGKIREKVSEEQLIHWLGQIAEKEPTKSKVNIQRRRSAFDDDDW